MILWAGFVIFVVAMLALDLGVFHRRAHVIHMREALVWTAVWIGLALMFNAGILYFWGPKAGLEFLTGYLVEKSLSMDNVFVFLLIFTYFKAPPSFQHKVLFWGIVGAIVARTFFIVGGLANPGNVSLDNLCVRIVPDPPVPSVCTCRRPDSAPDRIPAPC
jgi:tellurite resistance protein TerC